MRHDGVIMGHLVASLGFMGSHGGLSGTPWGPPWNYKSILAIGGRMKYEGSAAAAGSVGRDS